MSAESSKRPVGLRDIASELGISVAAVSLALADHVRISAATKAAVLEAAARLGYQRSAAVSATLRAVRSGGRKPFREAVACVAFGHNLRAVLRAESRTPRAPQAEGTLRHLANLARGLTRRADEAGCTLDHFMFEAQPIPALVRTLHARGIRRVMQTE